jgi:hypothetical protein
MFDIFLTCDFRNEKRELLAESKFSHISAYKDIRFKEYALNMPNCYVAWLERDEIDSNYLKSDTIHFFVYGSVFTNKKFQQHYSLKPHKVSLSTLSDLYHELGEEVVNYLKGSFVIIIVDEKSGVIKAITDRLNVLPLYYCFKDNLVILSSSVNMIINTGFVSNEIDNLALTEQLLFDYMLRDHFFYKEIRQTENARIYAFDSKGMSNRAYWSVEELYHERLLPAKVSLDLLSEQLFENVNLYASDRQKVLVAFTGGFDGRTNVAMIRKPECDFMCYSYGKPGSRQIDVPQKISKKLNFNYTPIYLDSTFEDQYEQCAAEAVEFSNGTAPIMRANYPFAYKQLCDYSDLIITGLFGSEILRPIHNLGVMINNQSESIFLDPDFAETIKKIVSQAKNKNYLNPEIIESSIDLLIKEFRADYFDKYKNYDEVTRFFFFIIQEGIRKYFMQEIQIERAYVTTRFPYLDDDLIELIYKTTFAGMYNGFLGKNKVKRRKGQLLYAHIIQKYKPELGKLKLDRGYTSDDLLKPFPLNYLFLAKGVYKANRYVKRFGNDTFSSEKWTKQTIENILNETKEHEIFSDGLKGSFINGLYLKDLLTYSHIIALKKFVENN